MYSGTIDRAAPLLVSGAFNLSGGSFVGSSGTLTIDVTGSLNLMGGSFTSTNGRLEVAGSFNESGGTNNANNGRSLNATSGTSTPGFSVRRFTT